jgi:hypothetical protein
MTDQQKSDREKAEKAWEELIKVEAEYRWSGLPDQKRYFKQACGFISEKIKSSLKRDIEKEIEYLKAKHKDGYWGPSIPDYYRVEAKIEFLELIETVEP